MEHKDKPVYQTTTDNGTKVSVCAPDVPATAEKLKDKTMSALKEGSLPSNDQINKALSDAKANLESSRYSGDLDEQGKLLAKDAEDIIDITAKALNEKNKDDKLQKFFEDTRQAVKDNKPIVEAEAKKIKGQIKDEGKKIKDAGKGQNLDDEASGIVDDVKKEGEKIKDRGEKLGKEAKEMAKDVKPQAKKVQKDTQELLQSLKNFFWNFIKSEDFRGLTSDWIGFIQFLTTKKIKEVAQKEQKDDGSATSNIAKAVDEGLTQPPKPADKEELEQRTQDKFNELLNRLQSKPEYKRALRDFFELIDQLQDKLEILYEDTKKEVQEAAEDVKDKAEEIGEKVKDKAKEVKEDVKEKAKEVKQDVKQKANKDSKSIQSNVETESLWNALYDARDILGEFTGPEELDEFVDRVWAAYVDIREDEDLNQWFSDFKSFLSDIADSPDVALSDSKQEEAKELMHRGRELLDKDKWSDLFDSIQSQFKVLIDNIRNDSTTNQFAEKIKKFAQDFALNRQGYPDLLVLEDSLVQVKNMLVPMFKEQLAKIQIGKIQFTNETYDVEVKDIGFSGSFLPEQIDFHMRNDSHLDTKDSSKDRMRQLLHFKISNIKPEFRNFKFHYRRKSFPKIEDWGVADLSLAGSGAELAVTWVISARHGTHPYARLDKISCNIDKMDIHIIGEETKHDILDKMMLPFVSGNLKRKVQSSIEDLLRTRLTEVNKSINEFFQSRPLDRLNEKANQTLQQGLKKIQVSQ